RTFVNQKYDEIHFGVVRCNGVGNIFQQHGFTRFGLRHNHSSLPFSDRRKQIDDTRRNSRLLFGQFEFFFGEKWSEVFERDSVSDYLRVMSVDFQDTRWREELLSFRRRSNCSFYGITGLESEKSNLRSRQIDIVWRSQIVVI